MDKKKKKKKIEIKTLVYVQEPYIYKNKEKNFYSGFLYVIWNNIKNKLKDKYIFKEYFQESECDNNIHNKLIQKVQKKEYDILISAFYYDSYRITKNNYSLPLFVTPIKIIYPKNVNFNNAIEQFKDLSYSLFYPILFAFILCIILSFLLYLSNRKLGGRKSFFMTFAAMFGSLSIFSQQSTTGKSITWIKGIIISIIVFISFFFLLYIQAVGIAAIVDFNTYRYKQYSSVDKVKNQTFVVPEGSSFSFNNIIAFHKAKPILKKGCIESCLKYINNEDKDQYDGIICDIFKGIYITNEYPNLALSDIDLAYSASTLCINKDHIDLLTDLNEAIIYVQDTGQANRICDAFFPGNDIGKFCLL